MKNQFFQPELKDIRKEILLLIPISDLMRMASTTNLQDRKHLIEILFERAKEPAAQPYIHRFLREFNTTPSPLIPPLNIILQSLPNLSFWDTMEGLNSVIHCFQVATPFEILKNNCYQNKNQKETLEELGRNANTYTSEQISIILDFLLKEVLKGSTGFFNTYLRQQQCVDLIETFIKYLSPNELTRFKDYYAVETLFSAHNKILMARIINIFANHMDKSSLSQLITMLIKNMNNPQHKRITFILLSWIKQLELNDSQKETLLPLIIDILEDKNQKDAKLWFHALNMLPLFTINKENHQKIITLLSQPNQAIASKQLSLANCILPLLHEGNQYNSHYIKILISLLRSARLEYQTFTTSDLLLFLDSLPWIEVKHDKKIIIEMLVDLLAREYFDIDIQLENRLKKVLDHSSLALDDDNLLAKCLIARNSLIRTIALDYLKKHVKKRAYFIDKQIKEHASWIFYETAQPLILPRALTRFPSEISLWDRVIVESIQIFPNWHGAYLRALISEIPQAADQPKIDERKRLIQKLLIDVEHPDKRMPALDLLYLLHKTKQLDRKEESDLFDFLIKIIDDFSFYFWQHFPLFPSSLIMRESKKIAQSNINEIMNLIVNQTARNAIIHIKSSSTIMLLAERGERAAILVEELIKRMSKTIIRPFHDALNEPKIRYSLSQTIYHLWITIEDSELTILTSLVNTINDRQADVRIRALFLNTCSSWLTYTLNNNLGLIEKAAEIINSQKSSTDEITHLQGCMRLIMQIKPRIINPRPKDEPEASPNNPKII